MSEIRITVLPIGSAVIVGTKEKEIKVTIVEIMLTAENEIKYNCVWWDGYTRKKEWLSSIEVKLPEEDKAMKTTIGFAKWISGEENEI